MSKIKDMKLRYKVGVGIVTGAAVVGMAGGAFAYFTATGSGSGNASAGSTNTGTDKTDNAWTVTVTSDSTDALYPGTAAGSGGEASLAFTIVNSSPGDLGLSNVAVAVAQDNSGNIETTAGVASSAVSGCLATWFDLDQTSADADATATHASAALTYNSTDISPTASNVVDVAANGQVSGTATLTLVNDSTTSQDACQGATPAITVSAS